MHVVLHVADAEGAVTHIATGFTGHGDVAFRRQSETERHQSGGILSGVRARSAARKTRGEMLIIQVPGIAAEHKLSNLQYHLTSRLPASLIISIASNLSLGPRRSTVRVLLETRKRATTRRQRSQHKRTAVWFPTLPVHIQPGMRLAVTVTLDPFRLP